MIVSQKKPFEEVLGYLDDVETVVLTGCADCASLCKTGGEDEIAELTAALEAEGKKVLASKVLTTSCSLLLNRKELKEIKDEIKAADAVISMACGDGVQTVAKNVKKATYPSNDTMFVGETVRQGVFQEMCKTCGECVLGRTAAICPITRCGKSLLNGACGGSKDGKCEVIPENECAWIEIYEKLKEVGKEAELEAVQPLRDYKDRTYPQTIDLRKQAKKGA
ncbi:MAG: 5,10-methylenetetrahydrofolate reductase [Eubacteriaceae bacterium]|jgi:ferredoxin|nr:5,10-methylenetetrahydrofolate reductase [Eubacteriaceae bacterium]